MHNCGYGGGPKALIAMGALRSGIPEEQLPHLVELWRSSHKNVVRLWRSLEDAAKEAIRLKARARDYVGGVVFSYEGRNLFMELPSGRRLAYVNACIGENRFGNPSILYAGTNQVTHKWEMLETYSGKLTENLIQSVARDLLRDAMMRLDKAGFDIRMHVHDEIIVNEPVGGRSVDEVCEIMSITPGWAHGLPMKAAGFETDFYMKD